MAHAEIVEGSDGHTRLTQTLYLLERGGKIALCDVPMTYTPEYILLQEVSVTVEIDSIDSIAIRDEKIKRIKESVKESEARHAEVAENARVSIQKLMALEAPVDNRPPAPTLSTDGIPF